MFEFTLKRALIVTIVLTALLTRLYFYLAGSRDSQKVQLRKEPQAQYQPPDYTWKKTCYTTDYSANSSEKSGKREWTFSKYYDADNKLIEMVQWEQRFQYFYDTKGRLIAELRCRMYNCRGGTKWHYQYDRRGNKIGQFISNVFEVDLDTVQIDTLYYYDKANRLIAERLSKHDRPEEWVYYLYRDGRRVIERFEASGKPPLTGNYEYDEAGNMIAIRRKTAFHVENDFYQYDRRGNLIEHRRETNPDQVDKGVIESGKNFRIVYRYDAQNRLISEHCYSPQGKLLREYLYDYELGSIRLRYASEEFGNVEAAVLFSIHLSLIHI